MPQVQHHRLSVYTLAGAVSGAASTGLGAVVLHPAAPDQFQRRGAALAGFVGGAVSHAVLGGLAAFGPSASARREAAQLGASSVLSCLTSGLIGGALLSAAHNHEHPNAGNSVLAGAVGGVMLSAVALGVGAGLMCCGFTIWAAEKANALGDRLLSEAHAVGEASTEP